MVGLYYAEAFDSLTDAARLSASVTHAHPLAIEGAVLVATATAFAGQGKRRLEVLQGEAVQCELDPFVKRLEIAATWLQSGTEPPVKEVRRRLGNGIAASESCVTAIYIALRFVERPFEGDAALRSGLWRRRGYNWRHGRHRVGGCKRRGETALG